MLSTTRIAMLVSTKRKVRFIGSPPGVVESGSSLMHY